MNEQEQFMMSSLSSREMNRARRKARQVNKQRSRDPCDENGSDEPTAKKIKTEDSKIKDEYSVLADSVPDVTGSWGETVDWPLEYFCDQLCQDLFSSSWEVRHGAATALREVIKICGKGAGRSADIPREQVTSLTIYLYGI